MKSSQICHFAQFWYLIPAYFCIEEVLGCQPVFKSSKLDHYSGSYGQLKLTMFHPTPLGFLPREIRENFMHADISCFTVTTLVTTLYMSDERLNDLCIMEIIYNYDKFILFSVWVLFCL